GHPYAGRDRGPRPRNLSRRAAGRALAAPCMPNSTGGPYSREPDMVWIEPGFAIGSCPYAGDRPRIAQQGVRVVVALHEPDERACDDWASLGVECISIPTPDWVGIQRANFERLVELVTACLTSGKPVLLHCLAAINRAPTLAA